ncbi:hypothetical protein CEXT_580731 [Caerostris extrusa]|uniref:Uncharacterized protein n=1 Tax=Caerostris extrusa TaxID=172846 RepID=A0AAV4V2S2_CAEEX|nr:hypothetical protein CEXT_580731 [Caerostris extrusa]
MKNYFPSHQLSNNRKELCQNRLTRMNQMDISMLNSKLFDDICNGSSLQPGFVQTLRAPNSPRNYRYLMIRLMSSGLSLTRRGMVFRS